MCHLSGLVRVTSFLLLFSLFGLPQQPKKSTPKQHHPKRIPVVRPQPVQAEPALTQQPKQDVQPPEPEKQIIPLFDQNVPLLMMVTKKGDEISYEFTRDSSELERVGLLEKPEWCTTIKFKRGEKEIPWKVSMSIKDPAAAVVKSSEITVECSGKDTQTDKPVTYTATSHAPFDEWHEKRIPELAPFTHATEAATDVTMYLDVPRAEWKYTLRLSVSRQDCDYQEIDGAGYQPGEKAEVDGNLLAVSCFKNDPSETPKQHASTGSGKAEGTGAAKNPSASKHACPLDPKKAECDTETPQPRRHLVDEKIYIYLTSWRPLFDVDPDSGKLEISDESVLESIFKDEHHVLVVNGIRLKPSNLAWVKDRISAPYHIDHYVDRDDCKLYAGSKDSVDVAPQDRRLARKANGILVGPSKIFDVHALQQMLNGTAAQLTAIGGFDQASIIKAFGSIQGITRDTSFLAGQITTTQLPTIDKTLTTDVSTAPNKDGTGTATTTDNKTNTDVKSGGSTGTVPSAPTSSPLTPPSNLSVSSSDILAEQVQLNAQITTLRLLLQGALSDRLLVKNNRAVGARAQTTLGFPITIDPPRQYKHAVAEVRIIITPGSRLDAPVSVVNLLPQEKTYNVAKVTSRQTQFGAGVVVEAVNAGVNTGRAKDHLFLVKDTDTIALQYPFPLDPSPELGFWNKIGHGVRDAELFRTEPVGDCRQVLQEIQPNSIVFGWQFRPVLGADYVQAGQRQVFAQLALPDGKGQPFLGSVIIQTLWRTYDPKKHVLGEILSLSCDSFPDNDTVNLLTPIRVHDVSVSDLGTGQLQVDAHGEFFAPGLNVLSGSIVMSPTNFDGAQITLFGAAKDLLQSDSLLVFGADGTPIPFATTTNDRLPSSCGLKNKGTWLKAESRPDGNSTMTLNLTYSEYDLDDHSPQVVIGNKIFGLSDAPFYRSDSAASGGPCNHPLGQRLTCKYTFDAPTDLINGTQVFAVRDLAWGRDYAFHGTISLHPTVDSLTFMFAGTNANTKNPTKTFLMSGKNVKRLFQPGVSCLRIYSGSNTFDCNQLGEQDVPDNAGNVLITFDPAPADDANSVKVKVGKSLFDVSLSGVPKPGDPVATPGILNVGDSLEVTFTWSKPAAPTQVKFEDTVLIFTPSKKSLKVAVTTVVTKSAGQKQLRATMPDGSTILLPLRVVTSGGGGGGG